MNFHRQYALLSLWILLLLANAKANVKQPLVYPQSRIVGGSNAIQGQFPYQVSLRIENNHICGGSIISYNYIVTAAHCVVQGNPPKQVDPHSLTIYAGSNYINSGGLVLKVAEVKVHPSYKGGNNDIALLKLTLPLIFNEHLRAIPLAVHDSPTGVPVITSGWGRLSDGGTRPQILQYNTLMAVNHLDCTRWISGLPSSVFCLAHTFGNGVCNGDSGGSAVYNNTLVGVTNFVVGNCGTHYPDVYASVPYHLKWLRENSQQ
ncbi:serine protease SP24D-like [Stomoxys calcitrans]|uniref:serine protease SP24D-like n=1 Tax=Stomoxys calcitrans TaxID=35570 RepID=UPI0027E2D258|nr:serine protease SP24D-like [Stomoxys calcitrans]